MIAILLCLLVMLVLQILTPFWWWIMIVPFVFGVAGAKSGGKAFLTGFLSGGILWLGGSVYYFVNGSRIVAERMANMFGLGSSWLMILLTALIGAVAAGFSSYAGYAVRALRKSH